MPAKSALAAVEAATARGDRVSFDGNWRGKLWARWDSDPRALLSSLVVHADLMFRNHSDITLLLGRDDFTGEGADRHAASEAAFAAFPNLHTIASTAQAIKHVDLLRLSTRIDTRTDHAQTEDVILAGIVDRIGCGDAFAACVLHALETGQNIADAARTGLALAALKHSIPGDASLFRQADIDASHQGGFDVRR